MEVALVEVVVCCRKFHVDEGATGVVSLNNVHR